MNVSRGDIVLVDFPYPAGTGSKVRPALIIQNDRDNSRLLNTIAIQITSTTHRALEATQVFIETVSPEGKQTGLAFDSVVNCVNIVTLDKNRIRRRLGRLPDDLMRDVERALQTALAI